jgi:hypothetical protein
VISNLLGSGLGLTTSHWIYSKHLEGEELSKLYAPIATDDRASESEGGEGDEEAGLGSGGIGRNESGFANSTVQIDNPWESEEEIFGLGDEEDDQTPTPRVSDGKKLKVGTGVMIV